MKMTIMKVFTCFLMGGVIFFSGCAIEKEPDFNSDTTTTVTTITTFATTTTTEMLTTTTMPTSITTTAVTTAPPAAPEMGKVVEQDFIVNIAGIDVNLLDDPTALLTALGEPERTEENAAGGYWVDHTKSYYYSSVWVVNGVYENGIEKLDALFIVGDNIVLNKGVKVGCTKEDLIAAYGTPEDNNVRDTYVQYHLDIGDVMYTLFFSFENAEDDTVEQIQIGSDYFHH